MKTKLTAHVAADYVCNGSRTFIFTPLNAEFKSVASIELNGEGELINSRSVWSLNRKAPALYRWARCWMARSTPVSVV